VAGVLGIFSSLAKWKSHPVMGWRWVSGFNSET
jgi:hypothetical protein